MPDQNSQPTSVEPGSGFLPALIKTLIVCGGILLLSIGITFILAQIREAMLQDVIQTLNAPFHAQN